MPEPERTRTWFERNAVLASLLLFGLPFLLAGLLRSAGTSDTVAELTQIIVGVLALAVVATLILRARRNE